MTRPETAVIVIDEDNLSPSSSPLIKNFGASTRLYNDGSGDNDNDDAVEDLAISKHNGSQRPKTSSDRLNIADLDRENNANGSNGRRSGKGRIFRSYLVPKVPMNTNKVVELECTPIASPPLVIDRFQTVFGFLSPDDLERDQEYEVVFGVSTQNLCIADIEQITVSRLFHKPEHTADSISNLVRTQALASKVSIRNYQFSLRGIAYNSLARLHHSCYNWTLDLKDDYNGQTVKSYAISESGDYLATCGSTLELWDLNRMTQETLDARASTDRRRTPPPKPYARSDPITVFGMYPFDLSISWDGSQVAAYDYNLLLKVYAIDQKGEHRLDQPAKLGISANVSHLVQTDLEGSASFHSGVKDRQYHDPENERILVLGKDSVKIFSVHGPWTHLRTIHVDNLRSIQGRLFASRDFSDRSISVWNIDSGKVLCTIKTDRSHFSMLDKIALSRDATLLLEARTNSTSSYCAKTGIVVATNDRNNVMQSTEGSGDQLHTDTGRVISGEDLAEIYQQRGLEREAKVVHMAKDGAFYKAIVNAEPSLYQQPLKSNPCNGDCLARLEQLKERIYAYVDNESGLLFKIEKAMFGTWIPGMTLTIANFEKNIRKVRLPGLDLLSSVTFSPKDRSLVVIDTAYTWVFQMPATWWEDPQLISIQCTDDPKDSSEDYRNYSKTLKLVIGNSLDYERFSTTVKSTFEDTQGHFEYFSETLKHIMGASCMKQCPHGRLYVSRPRRGFKSLLTLKEEMPAIPPWNRNEDYIIHYLNRHINRPTSMAGTRYQGTSETAGTDTPAITMMEQVCRYSSNRDSLLEKLLILPQGRWIPRLKPEFNPMEFLLDKARTEASNMKAFKLCWEYCLRRAMSEHSTFFLGPVAACLPTLLDPKLSHSEVAKSTLRRMAFIPVPSRTFVMERHALIHPPEFRLKFWNPNPRPLLECEEPILQLELSGTRDLVNVSGNENFLLHIFAATFNMIWVDSSEPAKPITTSPQTGVSPSIFYWIRMSPFVALFKLNPWRARYIKSHDFPLDAFDNPAIAALIAYKWSTIGFYIWLTRFVFQCVYYLLVLIMVFLQIFSPDHGSLIAVFGIIAAMSSTFLISEISQFLQNPNRYLRSILYNLVDITAFALPLGGCINQYQLRSSLDGNIELNSRGPNSWLFSFSVLFIALHLLFELRVNRSVCQFVTIIVQIFSKIRIFFIIFLGGILAFTIALLHLLRGCVQKTCTEPTTIFPKNFYGSFSATFFFMGGKYDPISEEFNDENWAFHTMMIFYLFFTVILMLNVLIALINLAFDDGDTTWQLVWLQNRLWYIESAENMSYHIPGLRENYNIFPKEIYYCLSEAKVQECKTDWGMDDGQSSAEDKKKIVVDKNNLADPIVEAGIWPFDGSRTGDFESLQGGPEEKSNEEGGLVVEEAVAVKEEQQQQKNENQKPENLARLSKIEDHLERIEMLLARKSRKMTSWRVARKGGGKLPKAARLVGTSSRTESERTQGGSENNRPLIS
ncbi:hypothetical protein BGZ99_006789 [Dissophora globulifera]|uniref:Ion transport domain-containing protein n=1 Tax=Dissophora globulifera TaxID=979702 RepID=A0A9P6UZP0_9FUNG|nr:hypothetical protein BGZ99_006789 [Dissophora globulifera]